MNLGKTVEDHNSQRASKASVAIGARGGGTRHITCLFHEPESLICACNIVCNWLHGGQLYYHPNSREVGNQVFFEERFNEASPNLNQGFFSTI